ncbi:MAG TPA: hypothetical protein VFN89_10310 [Solirubrobacterales bacterium]|nr:hypothetical protein [Solirubrobacterales bacterium]
MNPREVSILVVAPTTSSNALGRALSVADLAGRLGGETRVYGPGDGRLWRGAGQHDMEVRRFSSTRAVLADAASLAPPLVVWVVKPLRPSWRVGELLARKRPVVTVLDLDDHDEALSREFRQRSLANRLRLHPLRMLHPSRVRQTRSAAVRAADAFTCSSDALARELCLPASRPRLRVPHPRPAGGGAPHVEAPDRRIHAGCLGTLREHKGLAVLGRLLERDSSLVLHAFDPAPSELLRYGDQVVAHAPATPLSRIYAQLDVALLPQGDGLGARLQVPAKLLDSLRFGVPALASPTPAIDEIAGDAYCAVPEWGDLDVVLDRIRSCAGERERLGAKGRARFLRDLSIEAQIQPFEAFIAETTRLALSGPGVPAP